MGFSYNGTTSPAGGHAIATSPTAPTTPTAHSNIAISPCCNPKLALAAALEAYSAIGFHRFEAFTSWAASALDYHQPAEDYLQLAQRWGMTFSSMHLPAVGQDIAAGVAEAVAATRFAAQLGATIVLFKAVSRPAYIEAAPAYLDAIQGLGVTPVLQNHAGTAITTLDDFRQVIDGVADPRMKTLLEVGHFHKVGVSWRQGYHLLGDSVALVHIKDMIGGQSVPFGAGEVDLPGLFEHLTAAGYRGQYVVEMEVKDGENTLKYLADAKRYLGSIAGAML
ncbi:MAG: TIM barrel protein [Phycisphaeraceae bacterium]